MLRHAGGKGQPLRNSEKVLEEAKQQLDDLQGRLDGLDSDINQVTDLERQTSELAERLEPLATELGERGEELQKVHELEQRVESLATQQKLASQEHKAAADAVRQRTELIEQIKALASEISELRDGLEPRQERKVELEGRAEERKQQAGEAAEREAEARRRREAAQSVVELLHHTEQLERLEKQQKRVEAAAERSASAKAFLDGCRLDEKGFEQISSAHQQQLVARKALGAGAPTVEVRAQRSVELEVNGESVSLDEGANESRTVEDRVVIEVPDMLSVEVTAGSSLEALQRELTQATRELAEACDAAGVADMAAAEKVEAERERQKSALRRADDEMESALGGLDRQELLEHLEVERAALEAFEDAGVERGRFADAASAESALQAAKDEEETARQEADQRRSEREAAAEEAGKLRESVLGDEVALQNLQDQHRGATERLEAQRAETKDDELAEAEGEAANAELAATGLADEARTELVDMDPSAAALLEENARKQLDDARSELRDVEDRLIKLRERVAVAGGEGLGEQRDAALVTQERAGADHRRLESRASAAKALYGELNAARDEAYRSYREPLRKGICDVGRVVFGPTFDVVLGDELQIVERVLEGETLPWDSLSSGAKEQLAVLTAIAAAQLAADGGTPLILDDTLGYTDPTRLETLGAVLGAIEDAQVIVLTCVPERFRRVGGAETVSLLEALAAAEASTTS